MDGFIKNIKKKLSVDNLVDMMKDSKVIDEDAIKEANVRSTLSKLDPDSVMDIDEMAGKLSELSEKVATKSEVQISTSRKIINAAKSGIGAAKSSISALKSSEKVEEPPVNTTTENDYLKALGREENVFKLYDDFN